ncbi:MAG: DMT family transporter [Bifidobacteriaceae bacterium]|jgi:drug/metabolite transporter (DMT)-like permease|nr:DMT family transporter [Bifidobacteriaceae bacterium]
MMEALAVAVALASALCFAGSFVAEQHAASRVSEERGKGLRLFRELARSPIWWAGACGDLFGFALQALALAFGSVVLVQPVLVTSMVFALPLAARWNGRRIQRADVGWSLVVVAALAVFTIVGDTSKGRVDDSPQPWLWPAVAFGAVCVCLLVTSWLTRGAGKALALGTLAGVTYGVIAPVTELVVVHLGPLGALGLLRSWPVYALAALMLLGTAWQQAAFHAGDLGASLPATQVLEPVVAVGLGFWVLDARLQTHGWGWVALAAAGAAMVIGTARLARGAARPSEA